MLTFDRKRFFDGYRQAFGPLKKSQADGLESLLAFIEADEWVTDIRHAAYILATSKHETADTYLPIHEYGSRKYFVSRYGSQTAVGRRLGNDTPEEGAIYAGRGYPQVTGESNYERLEDAIRDQYFDVVQDFERRTGRTFDLTAGDQPNDTRDPDNMMDAHIAYAAMSYGMRTGLFTGKDLDDYINERSADYVRARRIINGNDRAELIAGYAVKFEKILRASHNEDLQADAEEAAGGNDAGPPVAAQPAPLPVATPIALATPPVAATPTEAIVPKDESSSKKSLWASVIGVIMSLTTIVTGLQLSREGAMIIAVVAMIIIGTVSVFGIIFLFMFRQLIMGWLRTKLSMPEQKK